MLMVDRSEPGYLIIREQLWFTSVFAMLLGGTAIWLCISAWSNAACRNDLIGAVGCFFFLTLFVLLSKQSIFVFDLTRHTIRREVRGLLESTTEIFPYGDIKSVAVALSSEGYDTPLKGVVMTTKDGRMIPLSKAFYGIYRKGASPQELEKLIREVLNLRTDIVSDEDIKNKSESSGAVSSGDIEIDDSMRHLIMSESTITSIMNIRARYGVSLSEAKRISQSVKDGAL